MYRVRFLVLGVLSLLAPLSVARGERVGFQFTGALQQTGSAGNYTLFGIAVPKTSPVKGTFAYDTTSPGIDSEPGVRFFAQGVSGGFNLDINNGAVRLSASDYRVTVANDFERSPDILDLFSIDFDSRTSPTPTPVHVNGTPWGGPTAYFKTELNWSSTEFVDANEPKLTSNRPLTPNYGFSAFVGSSATPRFFSIISISAIAPLSGDYNSDGLLSNYDYSEWNRAFHGSSEPLLFADGNGDNNVDAADYTVWRDAIATNSMHLTVAVPEVRSALIAAVVFSTLGVWFRPRLC